MRTLNTALSSLLPLLVIGASSTLLGGGPIQEGGEQEAQDETDDFPVDPFRAFSQREAARIEAELEGAWLMISFQLPDRRIPPSAYRGFVSFQDGYMAWILSGRETLPGLLGVRHKYLAEANAYRYEVGSDLTLLTATMLGFEWDSREERPRNSLSFRNREFEISLEDDVLKLWRTNEVTFEFSRLKPGAFPDKALQEIRRSRSGLPTNDREFR